MAVSEQAAAIERARKGYAAFDAGDAGTVMDLLADNVVWHIGGDSKYTGDYNGKEATAGFFMRLMQDGVVQKHDIHDILASDDHVVVMSNVTVTHNGQSITGHAVDIIHENDSGQTAEFWRFSDAQKAFDDLVGK